MGLTLSHTSALFVTRTLRSEGVDIREFDAVGIARPSTDVGARWSMREFNAEWWRWPRPNPRNPLHVLVSSPEERVRMSGVVTHLHQTDVPARSVLWLDEHASMVSPEMLFVQLASVCSLPELVTVGYELCGGFCRCASNPRSGEVTLDVPPVTSVEELRRFVDSASRLRGLGRARDALAYICDNAVSVPEAVLATMYTLPVGERGYGMGPLVLNKGVTVAEGEFGQARKRYPDILFTFSPVGINYDGENHLDLDSIVEAARQAAGADAKSALECELKLQNVLAAVRAKVVDDMRRNRELLAQGTCVLPLTKEDLYGPGTLDAFTRQLLACARKYCGVDTRRFEQTLQDTALARDRDTLLRELLAS